jgi:hypothetical protein
LNVLQDFKDTECITGWGVFTIVITPNGQRRSHRLHPVQPCSSCNTACLRQATTCKLKTPGGQAATHQPQPVQRGVWMWGSFM